MRAAEYRPPLFCRLGHLLPNIELTRDHILALDGGVAIWQHAVDLFDGVCLGWYVGSINKSHVGQMDATSVP